MGRQKTESAANVRLPVRRSVQISDAANEKLRTVSKALRITQWDLVSGLLELADPNDPKLKAYAEKLVGELETEAQREKRLLKRLKGLSTEEVEKALAAIGKG